VEPVKLEGEQLVLDSVAHMLTTAATGNVWLAPLIAFGGGLLTAANPCVLAMVPLMIGFVAGQRTPSVAHSFLLSLIFTTGLTITFAILFLATWAASSLLGATWWTYVAGGICLLMGLHLLGLLQWQFPGAAGHLPRVTGVLGALALGLLFGLVSLPCAGPVLLALLAIVPLKGWVFGASLLVAYSVGHCGLVLIGGTSMGLVQRLADSRGWNRSVVLLRRAVGIGIVIVGLSLLF
jgi:cytochrome c biogenesis protein CcdA